jgi:hypothetical protein
VVTAALLVAFGSLAIAGGAASLPWMATLGELLGFPRGHGPRLLAGSLFAMAAIVTLAPSWSKRISLVAAGTLVFAGFASVSSIRATRLAGPDGPGLSGLEALTVAIAAMVAVVVGVLIAIRAYRSASPESRGLSVAWRIGAAVVALGGGLAIAAPEAPSRPAAPNSGQNSGQLAALTEPIPVPDASPTTEVASIDLDVAAWTGRPMAETPIADHLPDLAGTVGDEPVFLVLYSGRCGTCHDLFRERFAGELPRRVLAIEIPPASDAILAAGDALDQEIECPGCERLSLPAGPRWLVRPPTVVRVDGGVVTCVDDASSGSCFAVTP